MSRRETFLESARAENDRQLALAEEGVPPTETRVLKAELREIRAALARLEGRSSEVAPPAGKRLQRPVRGSLRWRVSTWILAGFLLVLLLVTALRPEWGLSPTQKADLILGQRMSRILESLEEEERSEILGTLWEGVEPPVAATD